MADRLRDAVRDSDTVARLGGDEFAILQLEVSDVAETTVVARRIVQSISEIFDLGATGQCRHQYRHRDGTGRRQKPCSS